MDDPIRLHAAGSLSRALAGIDRIGGRTVAAEFGASGLLRARILHGADWDLFASADVTHPAALHAAGIADRPRIFCHNGLSLIVRAGLEGADALALLRRDDLRLGTSTPGNDPSGDYAMAALARLEAILPGAGRAAMARAVPLTGAPGLPEPPAGRNTYAWLVTSGRADLFLTYRTTARAAVQDSPALRALDLPDAVQVRASYALTTRRGAPAQAVALADHILSPSFQTHLSALGFDPARDGPTEGRSP
ncbi:substrate-binding domain-containing protein [Aphanothece stagnina]|uniref:substrate-binding domain-containing protein n=1 Tax=Aphanothece stagnina TaxID=1004305 RepID=UPI00398EDD2C